MRSRSGSASYCRPGGVRARWFLAAAGWADRGPGRCRFARGARPAGEFIAAARAGSRPAPLSVACAAAGAVAGERSAGGSGGAPRYGTGGNLQGLGDAVGGLSGVSRRASPGDGASLAGWLGREDGTVLWLGLSRGRED